MEQHSSHIRNTILVLFMTLLGTSGCVPYQSLHIEPVEQVNILSQIQHSQHTARIIVGYNPQNNQNLIKSNGNSARQAGILGMIVESIIINSQNNDIQQRNKYLTPIRGIALEFNFGSKLRVQVEQQFKQTPWLDIQYVEKAPDFQRSKITQLLEETNEDLLIVIDSTYLFHQDLAGIDASSFIGIYPRNKQLIDIAKKHQLGSPEHSLYLNTYSTIQTADKNSTTDIHIGHYWTDNNGVYLHQALADIINELVHQMTVDLKPQTPVAFSANNVLHR